MSEARAQAFRHALAFMREIDRRASSRVERLPFGTAYLRPEVPRVWSRNFVWVDRGPDSLDRAGVIEISDRLQAEAGLAHRRLVFEAEAAAGAFATLLQPQGWKPGRNLVMPHRGPRSAPPAPAGAVETEPAALRPMRRKMMQLDPQTATEEVTDQLLEAFDVVAGVANERSFAYRSGGEVVSGCRLYSDGITAQVEDVNTLPSHRGHGLGNACVLLALQEAWAAHEFVFIEADANDWPKDWYARAGFEAAGEVCDLTRTA